MRRESPSACPINIRDAFRRDRLASACRRQGEGFLEQLFFRRLLLNADNTLSTLPQHSTMRNTMDRRLAIKATTALTLGAAGFLPAASRAQAARFPSRPVRLIVPFAPGGGTDVVTRLLAKGLESELGQTVIVDNKPGGATIVGARALLAAPADGYTWMAANIDTLAANPSLYKKLPYDVGRDFELAGLFVRWPMVLVASKQVNAENATALLNALRTSGRNTNYASYGTGTMPHLGMELLAKQLGVSLNHVPYKGSAPALQALMSGEVSLMLMDLLTALPQIKAGTINAYAMTTKQRSKLLPNLPTLQEVGVTNFDIYSWTGVILPKGVDQATLARISAAVEAVAKKPEFMNTVYERGAEPLVGGMTEFRKLVDSDSSRLKMIISDNKITLD